MKRKNAGFTLIELLIVVLIIGILAAIAIPQYYLVVERSRVSEATSVISAIKSSEERYLLYGGAYTAVVSNLDVVYPNTSGATFELKYFNFTIATADGTPSYTLTAARKTSPAVPDRYGAYSIRVNVPSYPIPTIAACGTTGNCDELLQ
jgi:prepilin-type N-terminal cleavage/methylation domain-containing protein